MRELFYELIKEASIGKVEICDDEWPVSFNTIIEGETERKEFYEEGNLATLYIKDEEKFLKKLEEYIDLELQQNRKRPSFYKENEKYNKKWIMMYLFSYATTEDFVNPLEYVQRKIDFLRDNSLSHYEETITIPLSSSMKNLDLEIEKVQNPVSMETPNRMQIRLREGESIYHLPSIYYGIREENHEKVCYIYGVLKPKEEDDEKLYKKVNRLLFKLNDGVEKREDYNSEEESNIKDVSMPFVFSLNIFVSLLQREGIQKIKVVSYLPMSYSSREQIANERDREDLRERNQKIQENLTNKLIRTFRRLSIQNQALEIETYPYEVDEYLTLSLKPRTKELDNMLLEETNRPIVEQKLK